MSKGSVHDYLQRADGAGMTWERARELDDGALEGLLFTAVGRSEPPERAPIDLQWVRQEMRKTGVTLQLVWSEYREHVLADGGQQRPYQYSQFCELYRPSRRRSSSSCGRIIALARSSSSTTRASAR